MVPKIHELKPAMGSKKRRKIVGRGGCHGTYSGRGLKGQKARSGVKIKPGFEGGTTSLIRLIPKKRGFKSIYLKPEIVNVSDLQKNFKDGDKIDLKKLMEINLISSDKSKVKILGDGELTKKLLVQAHDFSESARKKIEKNGGKAIKIKDREILKETKRAKTT